MTADLFGNFITRRTQFRSNTPCRFLLQMRKLRVRMKMSIKRLQVRQIRRKRLCHETFRIRRKRRRSKNDQIPKAKYQVLSRAADYWCEAGFRFHDFISVFSNALPASSGRRRFLPRWELPA